MMETHERTVTCHKVCIYIYIYIMIKLRSNKKMKDEEEEFNVSRNTLTSQKKTAFKKGLHIIVGMAGIAQRDLYGRCT